MVTTQIQMIRKDQAKQLDQILIKVRYTAKQPIKNLGHPIITQLVKTLKGRRNLVVQVTCRICHIHKAPPFLTFSRRHDYHADGR